MRSLAVGSLLAGASVSLWGCGGGGDTTVAPAPSSPTQAPGPAPTPYDPTTVQKVWDNHFGAFGAYDVQGIMKDYDATSKIATYNDNCFADGQATPAGLAYYEGVAAITGFFEALFSQLNETEAINFVGPKNEKAVVKEGVSGVHDANVFLTWSTRADLTTPIVKATDSFSFKKVGNDYKIDIQTIVTTEEKTPCPSPVLTQKPDKGDKPINQGWDNHLASFGTKNITGIMMDYDENSIVQVYDFNGDTYTEHTGLVAIETMFVALFKAITDGATTIGDPDTEGVQIGLLEVDPDFDSVFLAWKSNSHPKATDTFIFNGATIARQNIVVTTKSTMVTNQVQV